MTAEEDFFATTFLIKGQRHPAEPKLCLSSYSQVLYAKRDRLISPVSFVMSMCYRDI